MSHPAPFGHPRLRTSLVGIRRSPPSPPPMASLFAGKVLIVNNRDRDEVETERERCSALENRVMLLYFGAAECPRCQSFAPRLKDFFVRLTDEFYVERASQLCLVYVSRDATAQQEEAFLRSMPRRWLSLPFRDEFKRWVGGLRGVLRGRRTAERWSGWEGRGCKDHRTVCGLGGEGS